MKPLRVLVVGWTATTGGIEHFLMAYCGKMNRERVQFDFLCRFSPIACQKEAEKIGKIYTITRRSSDMMRYYREINDFFREHGHEYDIIWDNECMFNDMTPLKKAAEVGIPVRIAHCHNPQNMDKSVIGHVQGFLHRVNHHSLSRYANVLWACSMESAKWACPAMDLPCEVIPNAIDAQMFRFSEQVRREVREQYGLEDCLVVGHVGRLQYQKNQTFLLDAFRHLHEREEKARLVLVGDGPDLTELEAKAVTLGIEREVLFLGNRDDVNRLLQAFDLFVMPSHFEGFGMAALEAQAAGLPCLLSASVPRETKLTRNVEFIPAEDPAIWAEHMLNMLERHEIRRDEAQTIADAGYDIGTASQRLEDKLIALTERKRFQRRFLMTPKTSASGVPALNKARADIEQIAAEMGYAPFVLHAPDSATRSRIMPVNNAYDVEELFAACHRYFKKTGRRISFEYAMIDGVNGHDWQADLLAEKIHGMPGHVNLIPLNDVVESEFKPSKRVAAFQKRLESPGLTATVRRSLGGDIDASCGQLRRKEMKAREGAAQ
mgnify:CR=1 FL=1